MHNVVENIAFRDIISSMHKNTKLQPISLLTIFELCRPVGYTEYERV